MNCEPGGGHKRVNWVRSGFIVRNNSVRMQQPPRYKTQTNNNKIEIDLNRNRMIFDFQTDNNKIEIVLNRNRMIFDCQTVNNKIEIYLKTETE